MTPERVKVPGPWSIDEAPCAVGNKTAAQPVIVDVQGKEVAIISTPLWTHDGHGNVDRSQKSSHATLRPSWSTRLSC